MTRLQAIRTPSDTRASVRARSMALGCRCAWPDGPRGNGPALVRPSTAVRDAPRPGVLLQRLCCSTAASRRLARGPTRGRSHARQPRTSASKRDRGYRLLLLSPWKSTSRGRPAVVGSTAPEGDSATPPRSASCSEDPSLDPPGLTRRSSTRRAAGWAYDLIVTKFHQLQST